MVLLLAFPVSPFLLLALTARAIARRKKSREKPWAKALAGMMTPVAIALAMLCVFILVVNAVEPTGAQALLTTEDRLMLWLYKNLRWITPSTTVYLLLLAGGVWLSNKAPQGSVVRGLSRAKGLIGNFIVVITLLASVTFFGNTVGIHYELDQLANRLQMSYQDAKKREEDSARHYLAETTVSQALLKLAPEQRQSFKTCFETVVKLGVSNTYQDYLSKSMAASDTPPAGGFDVGPVDSSGAQAALPSPQAAALPSAAQDLAPIVANEEQAAARAAKLDADSAQGLKKIASEIIGTGNDLALEAASHYLDHVVTLYAGAYGAALLPFLDDFLQPYSKKVVGEYIDKVVDYVATKITWRGIPAGSPQDVASAIHTEVAGLARANLQAAAASATAISSQVGSAKDLDALKDLSAKATAARREAEDAGQAFGASSAAATGAATAIDIASQAAALKATQAAERAAMDAVAKRAAEDLAKGAAEGAARDLSHL